jgi:hypothetical protein
LPEIALFVFSINSWLWPPIVLDTLGCLVEPSAAKELVVTAVVVVVEEGAFTASVESRVEVVEAAVEPAAEATAVKPG